uniref:CASP-like protein n=1 Tax=Oryza barthii TaxID=65489 RepID=A0A0D3ETJ2_9ORYZ
MSAGSAAAAVANLNRTGIRHTALPNFCKPLPRFCDLSAASIAAATRVPKPSPGSFLGEKRDEVNVDVDELLRKR